MKVVSEYHTPVLLQKSIDGLQIDPTGIYVDVTFGGGGHSRAILEKLTTGKLIGFDKDKDATENEIQDERFTLVQHDFLYIKNFLRYLKAFPVNGILADLGVSSHQFDTAERGFSYRYEALLDMRMDQDGKNSAYELLNNASEEDLHKYLGMFGEIKNARSLAKAIVTARKGSAIETTAQLFSIIESCAHKEDHLPKYAGMVFQALRIKVNNELIALIRLLEQSHELLIPGGRLAIITYHSLEDRLVKNFFKNGSVGGKLEKDFYGNSILPLRQLNKKPILPSESEITLNKRARSAKLRVAERI